MRRQKSQQTYRNASGSEKSRRSAGTLFIIGMPIGSPDDLTLRARTILGQVSIVVAETPLVTRMLLDYHGISATVTGYEGGSREKIAILLDRLNAGHDIALVSDSGMPVIYDPGQLLIAAARASGHSVTVVPGPSALTAAAALSGVSADRLLFVGKLPRSIQQLDRFLAGLTHETGTTVMYAASSALPRLLERMRRIMPGRTVTLAVNMTHPDERVCQGNPSSLLEHVSSLSKDSEVTLVLTGVKKRRK